MAFETSEAFYAGLSTFSSKVLERAKTNQEAFNELYEDAIDAFRDSALDGAGNATKKGMIDTIESKEGKGRGAKGLTTLYSDLASVQAPLKAKLPIPILWSESAAFPLPPTF